MRERFFRTIPWLVLVLLLAGTAWMWERDRTSHEARRQRKFERLVRQATAAIVDRVDTYSDAHHGGAALFHASEEVTRDEWRRYVDQLQIGQRHPGIFGLGYIEIVPAAELAAFTRKARASGQPDFRVRTTGDRDHHLLIKYIEPIEQNAPVLGFDMGGESGPLEAMERARDSGEPALSQRVILVQHPRQPSGFLLYVPIYDSDEIPGTVAARRRHNVGWVYSPFVSEDFIEGLLATTLAGIRSQISLAIYSGTEVSEEELLYADPPAEVGPELADWVAVEPLRLHGHDWTIVARPGPDFAKLAPAGNAPRTLAGGTVASLAIFGLLYSMSRTRSRALAIARQMTRDLEAQTGELINTNQQLALAVEAAKSAADALLEQHETLARTERMAAVGEMAGGLAHELRNPIAGIQMSLENLRKDVQDPETRERIDLPIAELGRLTRLLTRHLSPLRHVPEAVSSVNVRDLIEDLCALLRYRLPDNVVLEATVPADITWQLPRDRIRQSLLNLVLNAIHAIGGAPGTVEISAQRSTDALEICVEDDGPGFPEELLSGPLRRFDSHRAEGTGLGLAMVRRVASDLGGKLMLEQRAPKGARVRLELPASRGESQ